MKTNRSEDRVNDVKNIGVNNIYEIQIESKREGKKSSARSIYSSVCHVEKKTRLLDILSVQVS